MSVTTSQTSMIRGADGRLYAMTGHSVTEIADTAITTARKHARSGDQVGFDTTDYEAARGIITPDV